MQGLLPESATVVTALPAYQSLIILQDSDGEFFPLKPQLDTLIIDLDKRLISTVYRLRIPEYYPIVEATLGVLVPSQTKGACHVR